MENKKPQTVTIDDKEYEIDKLSDKAKLLLEHCVDLDRKIASMTFQRDQIEVGKQAFFAMLKAELEAKPEEELVQ